jgi:F-type H+-transporting ATPase subunit b
MAVPVRALLGALAAAAVPAALLASEGAAGEKPVLPPTVWGILVFISVLAILWWKAFPPISAALEKRERLIRESLEVAERARKETQALMASHEESLEKARAEARAIIEEGKADALKVKDKIVEGARKEADELAERALREIDLAKDRAVDDLHRQAVELSMDIAEKVIRKTLRPEDHRELIAESIRRFQEMKQP